MVIVNIIDLRDIVEAREDNPEQYATWKDAIRRDVGYEIDELAENEPVMIPDDDFEEYAQELAEDIGAVQKDVAWPACHIDWEEAADALKQDYTSVTVDDTLYWFRSY